MAFAIRMEDCVWVVVRGVVRRAGSGDCDGRTKYRMSRMKAIRARVVVRLIERQGGQRRGNFGLGG